MKVKTKSVVLFGDSFLGRFGKTLIDKLETVVSGVTVYNCAAGGFNTEDGVKRSSYIAKLKPNYVIFSFGANDAAPWKKQVSENDFEKNYDSILKSFSGSKLIIFPFPFVNDPKNINATKEFNGLLLRYNKIVKNVAEKNDAKLIDSAVVYGGLLKKNVNYHKKDGIHLNDIGYEIFIQEVSTLIS